MNSRFIGSKAGSSRKKRIKNIVISIVILIELIAIFTVASYAWVETVSSIKITNETNTTGTVDTYVFTEATIGSGQGTIDLGDYFKQSGDMHFAPCSSADGETMYFPQAGTASIYRKGNSSDMNTAYMSVSFRLKADTNADFFFEQTPTVDDAIRVSVTAYTEGTSPGDLYDVTTGKPKYTKIYANSASTAAVVNSTSGGTASTSVEAFSSHIKGTGTTNRLFAVGANETKIVTIRVWLQKTSSDMNGVLSATYTLQNLGITSSLTPRHVTLIPTPTWDISGTQNQTFYAWCWGATNGDADRLYKLEIDANQHYSFDYNGTYQNTLFFRCGNPNLTTNDMNVNWNTLGIWNKTADTSIPNDPLDPTYIIETISGGAYDGDIGGNKSTGSWHDPATVHVEYVTDQSSTWGSISAKSFIGTATSSHVMEQSNGNSGEVHEKTVHAWPGKILELKATANSNYAFVGWYDNAEGTGNALSTNATYTPNAPSTASEITYYAKFKEVRTLTIYKVLDGVQTNSTTAAGVGTITVGGTNSNANATSQSKTVDKGSSVSFSATASTGYTLAGFYTAVTGGSQVTSPLNPINSNTTYYARFTTNSYNVVTHARYSTNHGTSYSSSDNDTGGTVQTGTATAGSSSTQAVKYKSSVTLTATPAAGYKFVGWFSTASSTTALSTNTSYSYTLSSAAAANVYAKFMNMDVIKLKGDFDWTNGVTMTPNSSGIYSYTMTDVPEGGFAFKIHNETTDKWYGKNNTTITETTTNNTLSDSGANITFNAHAGSYTFTFNPDNNQLTISRNSYSNITITFNTSSTQWVGDDSAIVWFDTDQGSAQMTKVSNSEWTVSVPSNYATGISFKRNNSGNTATWNTWNAGSRTYSVEYKTSGNGTGSWQ